MATNSFEALNHTFCAPGSAAQPTRRRVPTPSVPTTASPGSSLGSIRNCLGIDVSLPLRRDALSLEELLIDQPATGRIGLVRNAIHRFGDFARLGRLMI